MTPCCSCPLEPRASRRTSPSSRRGVVTSSAPTSPVQLIADAEGAHHDIEIEVRSAATEADALEVARAIARNNLFKCAVFGNDPNWGRVLAAVGTTRAPSTRPASR
jgi:glutamate N-acetyltransferase/amino-acid N-acetyltransferase